MPSLSCGNHHGEIREVGIGAQLEVCKDKVVIRPVNFKKCCWLNGLNVRNSKPYLEIYY